MERNKTLGQIATDLNKNALDNNHSAEEQMREQLSEYDRFLYECADIHRKTWNHDFYLVVLTKKEKLLQNVIRNYFYGRLSCPTPDWDQTVYRYHFEDGIIEFMWTIPSKETCEYFVQNALSIPEDERQLLNFVLDFTAGNLLKLCKKLNNETENTGQLLLHEGTV